MARGFCLEKPSTRVLRKWLNSFVHFARLRGTATLASLSPGPCTLASAAKKSQPSIRSSLLDQANLLPFRTGCFDHRIHSENITTWERLKLDTADGRNPLPPKQPWSLNANKQRIFCMVSKRCELDFVHPQQGGPSIKLKQLPSRKRNGSRIHQTHIDRSYIPSAHVTYTTKSGFGESPSTGPLHIFLAGSVSSLEMKIRRPFL